MATPTKTTYTGPLYNGTMRAAIIRNTRIALTAGAQRVIGAASPLTPVNVGKLRASLTYRIETEMGPGSMTPGGPLPRAMRAYVGSPLTYAATMEYGRRAGAQAPPRAAIELWVRRQLRDEVEQQAQAVLSRLRAKRKKGARLPTLGALRERAIRGLAVQIQRSIKRKGIRERRMLRDGLAQSAAWVQGAIAAGLRSAIT